MNKFIIFTGPSGVGKQTLEKRLFEATDNLGFSVSATTRAPRKGEVHGEHYYFLSHDEFDQHIMNKDFLEWNEHFGNKYGTLKSEINRIQAENKIPLFEVETHGAKNIMMQFDDSEYVSIFIAPPSVEELRRRIIGRSSETEDEINTRIKRVNEEMGYKKFFDHVVINDEVDKAADELIEIVRGING